MLRKLGEGNEEDSGKGRRLRKLFFIDIYEAIVYIYTHICNMLPCDCFTLEVFKVEAILPSKTH